MRNQCHHVLWDEARALASAPLCYHIARLLKSMRLDDVVNVRSILSIDNQYWYRDPRATGPDAIAPSVIISMGTS